LAPTERASAAAGASAASCGLPDSRPADLRLAGSGSNLALVRAIAARFGAAYPELHIDVPPSIGSSGGVRAVVDGAVDVGLVSRPLKAAEVARGALLTPHVRGPVALVAAPDVHADRITLDELLRLMQGAALRWPDGTPRVLLLREPGDSGNRVLRSALPGYDLALERALAANRWRVCWTDQDQEEALLATPGSVGVLDAGIARLGGRLQVLSVFDEQGQALLVEPTALKQLGFVTVGPPSGLAARLIEFARSPAVADLLQRGGYELIPVHK